MLKKKRPLSNWWLDADTVSEEVETETWNSENCHQLCTSTWPKNK